MNVITQVEFELAYFVVAVQQLLYGNSFSILKSKIY